MENKNLDVSNNLLKREEHRKNYQDARKKNIIKMVQRQTDYDYDKINLGLDVVLDVEVLDNDVNLMIATNEGIRLINTDTDEMRQVSSGFIYDLEITNTGQIIAGTDEGILLLTH